MIEKKVDFTRKSYWKSLYNTHVEYICIFKYGIVKIGVFSYILSVFYIYHQQQEDFLVVDALKQINVIIEKSNYKRAYLRQLFFMKYSMKFKKKLSFLFPLSCIYV